MNFFGILLAIILLILILYLVALMPRIKNKPSDFPFQGFYYAHRGFHDNDTDAPENSIPAFRNAVNKGYGIELDVQLTKDNIAVVFHDDSLKRVCGIDRKVRECTFQELAQYQLCHSKETIPTFEEVLKTVDGKVPLIVEIKSEDKNMLVCELACRKLKEYSGVYCIESFNPMVLHWFKKNAPGLMRGQLSSNYAMAGDRRVLYRSLGYLLFNFWGKPDFIAYDRYYTNTLSRKICRSIYGCLSVAWTVTSQKQLNDLKGKFDLFIFEGFEPR